MSKTEARISLAVDAMGGDQGPQEVLAGVAKAVSVSQGTLDSCYLASKIYCMKL